MSKATKYEQDRFIKILVFRPFQFQEKEKANSGYKRNSNHAKPYRYVCNRCLFSLLLKIGLRFFYK